MTAFLFQFIPILQTLERIGKKITNNLNIKDMKREELLVERITKITKSALGEELNNMLGIEVNKDFNETILQASILAAKVGMSFADEHPHWISVKDRKPKLKHKFENTQHSDTVIVTDGEYRTSANWVHNIWAGWYGWFTDGDEELKGITHWMPMPSIEHLRETTKMIEKGGNQ